MLSWFRTPRRRGHSPVLCRPGFEILESRLAPATYLVLGNGDATGLTPTGGTGAAEDPFQIASLRSAIEQANALDGQDTITFAPALRDTSIVLAGNELLITDSLAINGLGADRLTIDGDDASRVFSIISGVTVTMNGLTISNGSATVGGGIRNAGALTLSRVTMSDNAATGSGGGIANSGSLILVDSTVSANTAQDGAGITNGILDQASFTGQNTHLNRMQRNGTASTVENMKAYPGTFSDGLTYAYEELQYVNPTNSPSEVTILFNSAVGANPAGTNAFASAYLGSFNPNDLSANYLGDAGSSVDGFLAFSFTAPANATIVVVVTRLGTAAPTQFGVAVVGAVPSGESADGLTPRGLTVLNSTISGNTATREGGGVYSIVGMILRQSTIVGNDATAGDGVHVDFGNTILQNTIVAGNLGQDIAGTVNSSSSNTLIGNPAFAGGLTHGTNGNILGNGSGAPRAIATILNPTLANNGGPTQTHALVDGSPAINAGNNSLATSLPADQRGVPFPRIADATVDIGAYEKLTFPDGPIVVDSLPDVVDANISAGNLSLREAILLANSNPGANTIVFSPVLYGQTITLVGGPLLISGQLLIAGPGADRLTLSGNNLIRAFTIDDADDNVHQSVTISGLTITAGNDPDNLVGGILSKESLTLERVVLTNSANGGIRHLGAGNLTIDQSTLSGNTADRGAGLFADSTGVISLTRSTFSGNVANLAGGGVFIAPGTTITIANNTFSANQSLADGGAIANAGTLSVVNSTLTLNVADSDDNSATQLGGGVLTLSGAATTLFNSLIAGNRLGGGAANDFAGDPVQSASSHNLVGDADSAAGLVDADNGNRVGIGGSGIRPLASILDITLSDNGGPTKTHLLVQNSPALGAASKSVSGYSPYDQRLAARDSNAPDIGAFEVQHPLAPVGVPISYDDTFLPTPSANANIAFVKGLYQSTLLRAADSGGLNFWVGQLNAGTSRTNVAFGFVNSSENRGNQVAFFYRYFLGRTADAGGLNFHVQRLQSGVDEGEVMTGFILSNEFSGQNSDQQFVNLMYYALLGRVADQGGFDYWMNQLTSGALTRGGVVPNFLRSNESIDRLVNAFAGSYVKREIDAFSQTNLRNQAQAGTTFGRIAAQILAFDEFFVAAGNHLS